MSRSELAVLMDRIGALVQEIEQGSDPALREKARELVQALLEVHRAGLVRLIELCGPRLDEARGEESVALLLALHDLYTEPVEARVRAAIDELAPRLRAQGVEVEVVEISDDTVRVRLGAAGEVRAADAGLRAELERAVRRGAPEIVAVAIDGLEVGDVPLGRLTGGPPKR
jgi:hypothetical protein